ncbi:MAG: type II toxin-antitoxin system death-on-curing family toxin [Candidatus Aenigmarchaeota archaeon]|nr:type II toxin-antitoxin system death-on-curing family toxin [Candidatus Aenigmarchaeota archaeon]
MNSEYIIPKEQIKAINERYGGSLRTDAEIETALSMGRGRNVYRKIAALWRAILVGHPFTDGNKRTALMVALYILESCDIRIPEPRKESIVREITKIARENITDINRIERLVRYAATEN